MKISQKLDYACRALSYLAHRYGEQMLYRTEQISQEEEIPKNFLSLIFHELKKKGFLESKRGKEGGWKLSRKPEEITLLQVVEAIDPELISYRGSLQGEASAIIHSYWQSLAEQVKQTLKQTTLDQLCNQPKEAMYYI